MDIFDEEDEEYDFDEWYDHPEQFNKNQAYKQYVIEHMYEMGFNLYEELEYCKRGLDSASFQHDTIAEADWMDRIYFLKMQLLFFTINLN